MSRSRPTKRKPQPQKAGLLPEKRTIMVLGSLVIGMALTAGVLRILEPGAVPPIAGVTLLSIERNATERPEDKLLATAETPHAWRAIVIHDSQTLIGSYDRIDKSHRKAGKAGCGYHMVINNGTGDEDGRIELGYRWKFQEPGDYLTGTNAEWYHRNAISICVIGDTTRQPLTDAQLRELTWLVRQLQQRFNIPSEYVFADMASDPVDGQSFFSASEFRRGLVQGLAAR